MPHHQHIQFQQYTLPQQVPASAAPAQKPPNNRKTRARTPSPSPLPKELPRHWDEALKAFFLAVGFTQCLAAFEADFLVMNEDWEKHAVPDALWDLQSGLSRLLDARSDLAAPPDRPLEERKLEYMHLEKGAEARSPAAVNKSISMLLARNRARNDASNRAEFLHAQKRRRSASAPGDTARDEDGEGASCARVDAKPVDRDVMMKFDIARNEEGPLRRTVKVETKEEGRPAPDKRAQAGDEVTARRYPGLDERLSNLETHLTMRYVPSSPVSLLNRIKFVEDHLIQLERDYPPWAALHFNQPRRGWPPPPRPTPVIVPSHLTSSAAAEPHTAPPETNKNTEPALPAHYSGKAVTEVKPKGRAARSSLHRAVLEKLEVQRAIHDLKGEGEPG
ncbi:hypothetical protein BC834DRAFT_823435 [Gloeopeniophorella convolvens]|nr:hypothetical protein BC834DRAFT_823435 [Gloeopeniophorella convolvens]